MWTHSCFLFCSCNNYCTSHSDRVNKSIWDLMQQQGRLIQYSIICSGGWGGHGVARKSAKSSKSSKRHITIILPCTCLICVCTYACVYLHKCAALQEESALPMLHLQSAYNTPVGHRTLWFSEAQHPL